MSQADPELQRPSAKFSQSGGADITVPGGKLYPAEILPELKHSKHDVLTYKRMIIRSIKQHFIFDETYKEVDFGPKYEVTLNKEGRLIAVKLISSSENAGIDKRALVAIAQTDYPAPPDGIAPVTVLVDFEHYRFMK